MLNSPSPAEQTNRKRMGGLGGALGRRAGVYLLLAVLAAVLHFASGSPRAELGSHPDEAAHFVTGLMVRDYVAQGLHGSPLKYADDYYRHYPKIGLGVWPPVFYLVQAAWTLGTTPDVDAVLRLMYLLGLGLAVMTARALLREYGWVEAAAGGALLTGLPLVQMYSNMVMAEALSAVLMFGAALCFARYLETEGWREAVGWGVCAGLAIMTKGTGMALALVPAMAMVLTGRYGVLRRGWLWGGAGVVGLIAGPWTWHFRNQGRGGWEEANPSWHFTRAAMGFYGWQICVALGGMLAVLALAGAVAAVRKRRPAPVCALALVVAVWIFQCLMPVGLEARHLMPAMPALIFLAMGGLRWVTRPMGNKGRLAVAAGVVVVFFGWPAVVPAPGPGPGPGPEPGYGSLGARVGVSAFRVPRKEWGGFEGMVDDAIRMADGKPMLVASDARGEGMFIAEVAMRDARRPSWTVERASKLMAASTWSGSGYEQYYTTPAQALGAVKAAGIGVVVMDYSPARISPHEALLDKGLGAADSGFTVARAAASVRDGTRMPGGIRVWAPEAAVEPER